MPTHSRLVVTSAVLLATEVYSSEVIQVAKCSARKKPAPQVSRPWRRLRARSTWPDCQSASGVMISAASPEAQGGDGQRRQAIALRQARQNGAEGNRQQPDAEDDKRQPARWGFALFHASAASAG
jgi:hypothetical protein